MKPNKENIITEILIELEKGTSFSDCFKLIQTKSNLVRSTFASYWKTANERHLINQQEAQKRIGDILTDNLINNLNSAILNKNEALEILTEIAKAEIKEAKEGEVPNYPPKVIERIQAIKTISEMQGWNAPIKSDIKTDNEPLKALSYKELLAIAHGTTKPDNS
mgnify:CR=1 FL=1